MLPAEWGAGVADRYRIAVVLLFFRDRFFVCFLICHLIIRACLCESLRGCPHCPHCLHIADGDSCRFGKMESGAQVHFSTLGVECVGEYPFGMFALILGRDPA